MELYLVRHGKFRLDGGDDPPLDEIGEKQAELTGKRLSNTPEIPSLEGSNLMGFDEIYVSPLLRALQTAEIICSILGKQFKVWYLLAEKTDYTYFKGLSVSEIKIMFQHYYLNGKEKNIFNAQCEILGNFKSDKSDTTKDDCYGDNLVFNEWWKRIGNGDKESYERACWVENKIMELLNQGKNKVLMIGHGTFWGILIGRILRCPSPTFKFSQNNCCITQFEILPDSIKLRYLNRIDHIPPNYIT